MSPEPIKTTLIHNAHADGASLVSSQDLENALRAIGLDTHHRATESEDDLDGVLEHPGDLVVAAAVTGRSGRSRADWRGEACRWPCCL